MKCQNEEFDSIIDDILKNEEFLKLRYIVHHGITRFDHSLRVAFFSYNISKKMKLDYYKVTRAALLHDFFLEENDNQKLKNRISNLVNHPKYALEKANQNFELSEMEKDIILTHMFPIRLTPPKYLESWLVDIVDDCSAVYEKIYGVRKQLSFASSFIFFLLFNYIK